MRYKILLNVAMAVLAVLASSGRLALAKEPELAVEGLGTFSLSWAGGKMPPAALVRFEGQSLDSPAYVLGCGHCNGMPVGSYVANRPVSLSAYINDAGGKQKRLPVRKIVFGTQTGVDLVLLELSLTYREIEAQFGIRSRLVARNRQAVGTRIAFYNLEGVQYCRIDELRDSYVFNEDGSDYISDAYIYYDCVSLGGHSGSVLISRHTDSVVGINVGGISPELRDGHIINYGSQVAVLYSCLDASKRFDISAPGCLLRIGEGAPPSGLTVLSRSRAEALFAEIAARQDIPFAFPDGCHAKAQKISMLLDERGVVSAKAFLEGNLFFPNSWGEAHSFWTFHVAPVVLVQEGTAAPAPYVIDPFLSPRLLSHPEWVGLMRRDHRTKIKASYFKSRFIYSNLERGTAPTSYLPEFVRDMEVVFKQAFARLRGRKGP